MHPEAGMCSRLALIGRCWLVFKPISIELSRPFNRLEQIQLFMIQQPRDEQKKIWSKRILGNHLVERKLSAMFVDRNVKSNLACKVFIFVFFNIFYG
jgi:hypothetical protein